VKIKDHSKIQTLGELKRAKYEPLSIKDEMRRNLISQLKSKSSAFTGILGYEETVLPDIQTAVLSKHNLILLGLRGQAKTRIARLMVNLLDEYIPIVAGSEMNDDPLRPISRYAIDLVKERGDDTPVEWVHRLERYTEKLATPDVTIADLIGDVDPIKAAALKLPYSDERVIHFGLIPRSHRSIFVINELPDLQARIQVALFNILQESDIQIRGFKVRLPLDIEFVFTANPEDYTNRGSIVTPLKDRIDSQILTHYPKSKEISREITQQESKLSEEQKRSVISNPLVEDLIEQIAFEARESEYIDQKSGVSARLTISAYENLISSAERRILLTGEECTHVRISDFAGVVPAITGKIELVYEGEQEGPAKVAQIIIGKAIRSLFAQYFPSPEKLKKTQEANPYQSIVNWFGRGNEIDLMLGYNNKEYKEALLKTPGLYDMVNKYHRDEDENMKTLLMEFALFGLSEYSLLSKHSLERGVKFKDILSGMFVKTEEDDDDELPDAEKYF
jgi:magnesium chelatase subunit I